MLVQPLGTVIWYITLPPDAEIEPDLATPEVKVGIVTVLLTVTDTEVEVLLLPAASYAIA
jgi:hypothetical protein